MESANKKRKEEPEISQVDYISQLPDSIIHYIYSFLPFKDVASTSALSKNWNRFRSTYPHVGFRFVYKEQQSHSLRKEDFLNSINRLVVKRLAAESCVQRFDIYIEFPDLESVSPYVDQWITTSVGRGIPELLLRLEIVSGYTKILYNVPHVLLRAESLRVLELFHCRIESIVDFKLPQLQELSLLFCDLGGDFLLHKTITGCRMIQDVKISFCNGIYKDLSLLRSPLLKHFELDYCSDVENVQIEAPNLRAFVFSSLLERWPRNFELKTCVALEELKLCGLKFSNKLSLRALVSNLPALELLDLSHCSDIGGFRISSQRLKALIFRCCRDVKLAMIDTPNLLSFECNHCDEPFFPINASSNLKFYLKLRLSRPANDLLIQLRDLLPKLECKDDLKCIVQRQSKDIIVHDNLTHLPLSSLCDFLSPEEIFISSMSLIDLLSSCSMSESPEKIYVIYSRENTIEVVSNWIEDAKQNPVLMYHKVVGFEVVDFREDKKRQMDPVTALFIEKHSTPPCRACVLSLNWERRWRK